MNGEKRKGEGKRSEVGFLGKTLLRMGINRINKGWDGRIRNRGIGIRRGGWGWREGGGVFSKLILI